MKHCFILLLCITLPSVAFAQAQSTKPMLEDIQAYVEISDDLSTSGQIGYDQIDMLKEAGFEVVINLAVADEERNGREGFLVTQAGMTYIQIPVSWKNPSQRDLQLFFDVMNANKDRKVYVHCFANMRVSAFVYLYRTLQLDVSEEKAKEDLAKIWDPYSLDQWANFMDTAQKNHASM